MTDSTRMLGGFFWPLLLGLGSVAAGTAPADRPEPEAVAAPLGKTFLTVAEALELAFPGCEVERRTSFLSEEQRVRAEALAKVEVENRIVYSYVATRDGKVVGTAYFDNHRVRSLKQTVMIVVTPDQTIGRIELLAFAEPLDYVPRDNWYGQFPGKRLDEELTLKRGIKNITGATLTASATTNAARRVLSLHAVLNDPPPPPAPSGS